MFIKSLITRVIILVIVLLTTGIGILTLFHIQREQEHLINSTRESAELLLSTVEKSIFTSMRLGNSEDVQAILPGVAGHRLAPAHEGARKRASEVTAALIEAVPIP